MPERNRFVGFGAGLVAGLVIAMALSIGHATPRAIAQPPLAAGPRFQISTWAYRGAFGQQGGAFNPSSGAYVLDTQEGTVWFSEKNSKLQRIGQAKGQ